MIRPTNSVPRVRPQPNSSVNVETALSVSAIALVSAANSTRTKNRIPTALPKPISANIFGIVLNISDGPEFSALGSPPEKAKTAGIIMSPASIAIPVSNSSTCLVESSMLTSFFIYEPNVISMPIAIDRE